MAWTCFSYSGEQAGCARVLLGVSDGWLSCIISTLAWRPETSSHLWLFSSPCHLPWGPGCWEFHPFFSIIFLT